MARVAVATTSQLAADAAAEISDAGGNAVDAAIAAALIAMNTEPGVCALAGGAYITIWQSEQEPVTIDGNVAVPGAGLPADHKTQIESVYMEYGGGIETLVGAGSVAVPGSLAAIEAASRGWGQIAWHKLFQPCVRATREGFPLSAACHYYLRYSGDSIFSRSDDGYRALHNGDGSLKAAGSTIVVPHLADSLDAIAREGSDYFYRGELAQSIDAYSAANGGRLTLKDLCRYEPVVRESLQVTLSDWQVATNPPPAVGGAVLSAMLLAFDKNPVEQWNERAIQQLIDVQHAALSYRRNHLDLAENVPTAVEELLQLARRESHYANWSSASTVHTSAVDDAGLACAITASSGYGCGAMPRGTGLWLNNCLGEIELNRRGLAAGPCGARLPSNMTPSVASNGKKMLAIGSPGADRITTALHQFLINYVQIGLPLADAIAHPRAHVEIGAGKPSLAHEPGINLPEMAIEVRPHSEIGMYFGGVGAVVFDPRSGFELAADPRREGATCVAGA